LYVSDRDGDFEIYLKFLGSNRPDAKLTDNSANDWFPDWSTAGRIVFTSNRTGNYDLYTMSADGSGQQTLVSTSAWDEYGNWAPDSSQLVFSTTADTNGVANSELHRRNPDGSLTRLTSNTGEDRNPDWAAFGTIFYADNSGGNWDVFAISSNGGSPRNLTAHPAVDEDPAASPDGRRLVFVRKTQDTNGDGLVSDGDSGTIYVMNVDGSGATAVTSGSLDSSPAWSPDGAWVVFSRSAAPNSKTTNLFAARVADGSTVQLTSDSGVSNWGASWAP
jgi:Tol biopolymer transport system component